MGTGHLREANPAGEVTIGMVGKYIELPDAYKSVIGAENTLVKNRVTVNIRIDRFKMLKRIKVRKIWTLS